MPVTPGVTLTANLQDTSGAADGGAALRITLCGYGLTLPRVAGTSLLAKVKQVVVEPSGDFSVPLWGNDQITPAGTFYEIAVLDDASNVVQAGMYLFTGTGAQDLSAALQLLSGQPYLTGAVPNGAFPGSAYQLPAAAVAGNGVGGPTSAAVYYNGGLQEAKWYSIDGYALLLEFETQRGDELYVQYATSVFGAGLPLLPWQATANGVHPGVAFTVPTPPQGAQLGGLFLNGAFQNPDPPIGTPPYTLVGQVLTMTTPTSEDDVIQVLYLVGVPGVVGHTATGATPGTVYVLPSTPVGGSLISLYNNTNFQRPGIDYTISGTNITMQYLTAAGDRLYAYYVAH